jgi:hypothetical protein
VTGKKGHANAVRKVAGVYVDLLREHRPHHVDAGHDWRLDGKTATVRTPGRVVVTALADNTTRLATA